MVDTNIQSALLVAMDEMPVSSQRIVLDVALRLAQSSEPTPGTQFGKLKHLVGTLASDVADDMEKAIEEHCERVDANEWQLPAGH